MASTNTIKPVKDIITHVISPDQHDATETYTHLNPWQVIELRQSIEIMKQQIAASKLINEEINSTKNKTRTEIEKANESLKCSEQRKSKYLKEIERLENERDELKVRIRENENETKGKAFGNGWFPLPLEILGIFQPKNTIRSRKA